MPTTSHNAGGAGRSLHRRLLAAVLLYQLALSTAFPAAAWHRRSPDYPATLQGERMVILGDGLGYYAWLRSLLLDADWAFDNEFDLHNPHRDAVSIGQTVIGRRGNPFSIGPACVWAPAVALTHLGRHLGLAAGWPADGYSAPYQLAVAFSAFLVASATTLLLFAICRLFARPRHAALAAALLLLGSTLINYNAIEVSMGHGCGTAATALLVWYWLRTYGSSQGRRWLIVGALLGLAALMRWQLAALAVLPAAEAALSAWRQRSSRPQLTRLLLAAGASVVVFLPQLVAWKVVYGSWLVSPMPLAHNWWQPQWARVLLGTDRSFFYWTPLTLLPLLGYLLCSIPASGLRTALRGSREPLALLLVAFVVQVYLLASISGDGVVLGCAFGHRQLTEAAVLLAPGLALLLEVVAGRLRPWLLGVCLVLVTWNSLLLAQYHLNLLPRNRGASPGQLIQGALSLLQTRPGGSALFLSGPLLLIALSLWRQAQATAEEGAWTSVIPRLRVGKRSRSEKGRLEGTGDRSNVAAEPSLSP